MCLGDPGCFIEQEALTSLLSTGWFQEQIWMWFSIKLNCFITIKSIELTWTRWAESCHLSWPCMHQTGNNQHISWTQCPGRTQTTSLVTGSSLDSFWKKTLFIQCLLFYESFVFLSKTPITWLESFGSPVGVDKGDYLCIHSIIVLKNLFVYQVKRNLKNP